jgi:hypothetical protein
MRLSDKDKHLALALNKYELEGVVKIAAMAGKPCLQGACPDDDIKKITERFPLLDRLFAVYEDGRSCPAGEKAQIALEVLELQTKEWFVQHEKS